MASPATDSGDGRLLPFHRLAAATAALTFVLVVVGIYTAVAGAGLTCGARWPLCDGWMGLFPANWPSFIEWFHRLIAMVAGFLVLGLTVAAWRRRQPRRVRLAATAALALLPSQIVLGWLTVARYEVLILTAHFGTAVVIFALLVAVAVWSLRPHLASPARRSAQAVFALVPLFALATPFFTTIGSLRFHVLYYALGFAAFSALMALALLADRGDERSRRIQAVAAVAAVALTALLLQGRLAVGPAVQTRLLVGAAATVGFGLPAAWWTLRGASADEDGTATVRSTG